MSSLLSREKEEDVIVVQTLSNRTIKIPRSTIQTVEDLKHHVCRPSCVLAENISIVSQGMSLNDEDTITQHLMKPIYAFIKTSSIRNVTVSVKHSCGSAKVTQVNCSLNSKLSDIKKRLSKDNVTDIRACDQRIIISGRVMKESCLLGDYLLHSKLNKSKTAVCTMIISKTINPRRELDIVLEMPNSRVIHFSFPCGEALYYAKMILLKQFGVPDDIPYHFNHSGSGAVLNDHDTLLDHGIASPTVTSVQLQFEATRPSGLFSSLVDLLLLDSTDLSTLSTPSLSGHSAASSTTSRHGDSDSQKAKTNKSLFKGMKKGFLSGTSTQSKSSVTVTHPAAKAARAVANKDIWSPDEIPTEAELVMKSQRTSSSETERRVEHPVRFLNQGSCQYLQHNQKQHRQQHHKQQQPHEEKHSHQYKADAKNANSRNPSTPKEQPLANAGKNDISKRTNNQSEDKSLPKGAAAFVSSSTCMPAPVPAAPTFNIRYKQEAGAVVKSFSPNDCTHVVVKIHFPHSRMKDLDLDVTSNKIKVASRYHRLITPLPVSVQHRQARAKFNSEREVLTVTLPILIDKNAISKEI